MIRQLAVIAMVAVLRFMWALSISTETSVSISEMEEVSAANSTSRKNTAPIMVPNFMESNTIGRVMNIRPGPLFT